MSRGPNHHQLHNERHRLIAQGLRAGDGFEQSARCAARYLRAKYGFVAIKDTEKFFICEIGLERAAPTLSDTRNCPPTPPPTPQSDSTDSLDRMTFDALEYSA